MIKLLYFVIVVALIATAFTGISEGWLATILISSLLLIGGVCFVFGWKEGTCWDKLSFYLLSLGFSGLAVAFGCFASGM